MSTVFNSASSSRAKLLSRLTMFVTLCAPVSMTFVASPIDPSARNTRALSLGESPSIALSNIATALFKVSFMLWMAPTGVLIS